jgi:hypothetical protein
VRVAHENRKAPEKWKGDLHAVAKRHLFEAGAGNVEDVRRASANVRALSLGPERSLNLRLRT